MSLRPVDLNNYLNRPLPVERYLSHLFRFRRRPVILDIGACEGEDSIRYSRLFPQARIFAFEPLPENQLLVQENLAHYKAYNVELVPVALTNHVGMAEFYVSSGQPREEFCGTDWNYGNKSSSLLPPVRRDGMHGWINFKQKIIVNCQTLDAFCYVQGIKKLDLIHMDVQGAEYLVMAGARQMLPTVLTIWLEVANQELYQGQKLRPEIEKFMKSNGFVLFYEQIYGAEGDQFYVNGSRLSGLLFLWAARVSRVFRKIFG